MSSGSLLEAPLYALAKKDTVHDLIEVDISNSLLACASIP